MGTGWMVSVGLMRIVLVTVSKFISGKISLDDRGSSKGDVMFWDGIISKTGPCGPPVRLLELSCGPANADPVRNRNAMTRIAKHCKTSFIHGVHCLKREIKVEIILKNGRIIAVSDINCIPSGAWGGFSGHINTKKDVYPISLLETGSMPSSMDIILSAWSILIGMEAL